MASGSHKIDIPFQPVTFDQDANNAFINAHGFKFEHHKAIICPLGMTDSMETRSPRHDHPACSNGFIYEYAGDVTVLVKNNSAVLSLQEVGIYDGSVLDVTFPTFYDDDKNKTVFVQLYDRFVVKDVNFLVPNTQRFDAQVSGLNKMTYKVEKVEFLMDSQGVRYGPEDYEVRNGAIVFTGTKVPPFDPVLNRGSVCSIRYLYTPFFYASRLMHEVRLVKQDNFKSPVRESIRGNYGALLSREYYLFKKEQAENPADSAFDAMHPPSDGMVGA